VNRPPFVHFATRVALAAGLAAPLAACAPRATVAGPDTRFNDLRDRYVLTVLQLNPVNAMYMGGDGWDATLRGVNGRLRDYSPEALQRETAFFREILRASDEIRPEKLKPSDRLDYLVLGAQIKFILHQLEDVRYYQRSVDTYVGEPSRGIDWQIKQMKDLGSGQLGTEEEWRLVTERLAAIPSYLDAARANLASGKASGNVPDARMVEGDGIEGSRENADYFRTALPELALRSIGDRPFASSVLPPLQAAAAAASTAYSAFATFLEQTYYLSDRQDQFVLLDRAAPGATTGFPRERGAELPSLRGTLAAAYQAAPAGGAR
jgi:uncharacterized protein (DUF885 family)